MPLNQDVRNYIEHLLIPGLPPEPFAAQLYFIMGEIIELLERVPDDAPPTAAYLAYRISSLFIRGHNQTLQADYASAITALLQRRYNDPESIRIITAAPGPQRLAVLINFYNVHHALVMNGLRSPQGPQTLDAFDALRMLQIIVTAAIGPWHAHIRLNGAIRDYHHARVRADDGGAQIEIGRLGRSGATTGLRVATWNLQGGSASTDNKWRTRVLALARQNDVVVLQEAGVAPFSSRHLEQMSISDQFGNQHEINHYLWAGGTASRSEGYQLFFLEVQRLRVNLAIVVANQANLSIQSVLVIADGVPRFAGALTSRPALGVRLRLQGLAEEIVVANIHAISGGGANSPRLLREISWHANTPYVLLGDFNRDPRPSDAQHLDRGDWVSPPEIARVVQANGSTHPSTSPQNMLDYAVSDGAADPLVPGRVDVPGPSDHLPVSYTFNFT